MVLRAYMRTEGNGMCNEAARNVFSTGSGTIQDMKDRVANAIYADLLEDAVFWPDEEERKVINLSFLEDFGIPNVSAILDGTLFGIAFTPQREDAGDFKGRKGGYTLTCLIANDHQKRIRYYHLGWPGSTHDDRVPTGIRVPMTGGGTIVAIKKNAIMHMERNTNCAYLCFC
jgi:hypothetical protein